MRKVFNKVMAGAMTTALVATLAVGFKVNTTDVKAEDRKSTRLNSSHT